MMIADAETADLAVYSAAEAIACGSSSCYAAAAETLSANINS